MPRLGLGLGLTTQTTAGGPSGPVNTVAPAITGTVNVGQTLTTTNGTWTGTGTITFARQWVNSVSGDISGATGLTYVLQSSDEGDNITCRVTATDDNGSTVAVSNSVGPVIVAAKTRAEWETQAAALATDGSKAWGTNWTSTGLTGSFTTRAAASAGSMFGSCWQSQFSDQTGTPSRMVQHGCPSQTIYDAIVADTGLVQFVVAPTTNGTLVALNRNGYTSLSDGGSGNTRIRCSVMRYWDPVENKAKEIAPFAGTGPVDYNW